MNNEPNSTVSVRAIPGGGLIVQMDFSNPKDNNAKRLLSAAREGLTLEAVTVGPRGINFKTS